jgi:predicted nucleic acid-binding protein
VKYLLDVSTLVALLSRAHVGHQSASAWRANKSFVLCPITELGFIRVCTGPAMNLSMHDARTALADFIRDEAPGFIPCDARALDGMPAPTSGKTTDWYLANLADRHGLKWATMDQAAKHPAAELIK